MAGFLRVFRSIFGASKTAVRPIQTDLSRFAEGDRVLRDGAKITAPLYRNQKIDVPAGTIEHNDILGQKPGVVVHSKKGTSHRLTFPTFDEYVSLAPRKVTPIYASYSNLIVSLLDIHVTTAVSSPNNGEEALEILEAGTGNGGLTLHLARAVQAANPPPPVLPPPVDIQNTQSQEWVQWRASRRAVIHSVELTPLYSLHAQKLIRGFRRGLYTPHIDFHISDVSSWAKEQINFRKRDAFLDHILLDMPEVHAQIEDVTPALKENGLLLAFSPSVSQIGDCVKAIRKLDLPLKMEKVVELGHGISDGRLWDVRLVTPRARSPVSSVEAEPGEGEQETSIEGGSTEQELDISVAEKPADNLVMVCRPKVGERVIGGGFIGIWRKTNPGSWKPTMPRKNKSRGSSAPRIH